jgi:hypothetical protein
MGKMRISYKIFVGKPEGRISLRIPRRIREDHKSVQVLAYADDLDVGRSERDDKEAFIKLTMKHKRWALI